MANPPGALPAYNNKGKLVGPPPPAAKHYDFHVLDGEGRDDGDAEAAAALLRGEELPPQEAFEDAEEDVEQAPPVANEDANEDPARLGLAAWVGGAGGAAILLFLGAAGAILVIIRSAIPGPVVAPPIRARGLQARVALCLVGVIAVVLAHLTSSPLQASGPLLSTDAASGSTGIRDITSDATPGFSALALAATHAALALAATHAALALTATDAALALALAATHAVRPPHVRDPPRSQRLGLGAWAWGGAPTFVVLLAATAATRAALRHPLLRPRHVYPFGAVYRDFVADVHLGPLAWTRAGTRLLVVLLACADAVRGALLLAGPRRARLADAHTGLLLLLLATAAAVLAVGMP